MCGCTRSPPGSGAGCAGCSGSQTARRPSRRTRRAAWTASAPRCAGSRRSSPTRGASGRGRTRCSPSAPSARWPRPDCQRRLALKCRRARSWPSSRVRTCRMRCEPPAAESCFRQSGTYACGSRLRRTERRSSPRRQAARPPPRRQPLPRWPCPSSGRSIASYDPASWFPFLSWRRAPPAPLRRTLRACRKQVVAEAKELGEGIVSSADRLLSSANARNTLLPARFSRP